MQWGAGCVGTDASVLCGRCPAGPAPAGTRRRGVHEQGNKSAEALAATRASSFLQLCRRPRHPPCRRPLPQPAPCRSSRLQVCQRGAPGGRQRAPQLVVGQVQALQDLERLPAVGQHACGHQEGAGAAAAVAAVAARLAAAWHRRQPATAGSRPEAQAAQSARGGLRAPSSALPPSEMNCAEVRPAIWAGRKPESEVLARLRFWCWGWQAGGVV